MAGAAASTRIAAQPGMTRVQLWAVDEHIWGIQTPERKICGGGPGQQQFLLLIEVAIPHGAGTDALAVADDSVPGGADRQHQILGRYWL